MDFVEKEKGSAPVVVFRHRQNQWDVAFFPRLDDSVQNTFPKITTIKSAIK